jgi:hypothetical protein
LFSIECLAVSACLEAATPLLYCCYMLAMIHLSSACYHLELMGRENVGSTVQFLFTFVLFQVESFVLLASVIKRNSGICASPSRLRAGATKMSLIQGKLMAWMVVTLCFRVIHFGRTTAVPMGLRASCFFSSCFFCVFFWVVRSLCSMYRCLVVYSFSVFLAVDGCVQYANSTTTAGSSTHRVESCSALGP